MSGFVCPNCKVRIVRQSINLIVLECDQWNMYMKTFEWLGKFVNELCFFIDFPYYVEVF